MSVSGRETMIEDLRRVSIANECIFYTETTTMTAYTVTTAADWGQMLSLQNVLHIYTPIVLRRPGTVTSLRVLVPVTMIPSCGTYTRAPRTRLEIIINPMAFRC